MKALYKIIENAKNVMAVADSQVAVKHLWTHSHFTGKSVHVPTDFILSGIEQRLAAGEGFLS